MITPVLPTNEAQRLAALHALNTLDTRREERFDRITRIAQRLFQTPIALITLVDTNRVWFRSAQGLSITQMPREMSFCGHAILGEDILVIPDALLDPRFADNSLVTDEPYLRFYAGRPLSAADGSKLGTLCILDRQPRYIGESERLALGDLAAWAERELLADEQAQQVARLKSEFLSNMSHELRTPMNGVLGAARLLLGTTLSERQHEYAETIRTSGNALLKIIDHILAFSTIEGRTLVAVEFSPAAVVEKIGTTFRPEAQRKGLTLTVQIDSQIPPLLRGDPDPLQQVLCQLIDNALKFTETGKIAIRANVESSTDSRAILRFTVRDTGIGLSAAAIRNLFEPFVQADGSASRKYGGTGLGLAISKRLVAAMDGRLDVESKKGAGSIFWFTIPLDIPTAAVTSSNVSVGQKPATGAADSLPWIVNERQGTNPGILLAEDHPVNRRLTALQLQHIGYDVHTVTTGKQAVEAIVNRPDHGFSLILMDCQMPEMDGLEATRRIRQAESSKTIRTPIIALTANALEMDRQACLAAGMDDFVAKPIDLDELCRLLEHWISLSKSTEAAQ